MRPVVTSPSEIARQAGLGCGGGDERGLDPGLAQAGQPIARSARIGVLDACDHARDTGFDQQVAAGRAARRAVRAGFERDIGGGAASGLARLVERGCLCMRAATGMRPAAADHAVVFDENAAHAGIGIARRA